MDKRVLGKELKTGDMIQAWTGRSERIEKIAEHRTTVINGKQYRVATAFCTNNYNITIFLDEPSLRLA